ncbi:hypothetical protein Tco_0016258 [Tanacetum coccineum]
MERRKKMVLTAVCWPCKKLCGCFPLLHGNKRCRSFVKRFGEDLLIINSMLCQLVRFKFIVKLVEIVPLVGIDLNIKVSVAERDSSILRILINVLKLSPH